jgi:SWI/SNF-related matrix-associated actin-dependent regulator of chromatin subfamily D
VNFEFRQGIPAWSLKVEGRLLEARLSQRGSMHCFNVLKLPSQRARDRVPPRKFSTLIKRMVVELDHDPTLYPVGNIIEVCELD